MSEKKTKEFEQFQTNEEDNRKCRVCQMSFNAFTSTCASIYHLDKFEFFDSLGNIKLQFQDM